MSFINTPAPAYETDPENFIKTPVTDGNGTVIGYASQFRGAIPSTAAGRYEYDRRREVLRDHSTVQVGDTYLPATKSASDRRIFRALSSYPKLAWNTREDLLRFTRIAQSQLAQMTKQWLDRGTLSAPTALVALVIPDEHVKEK